MIMLHPEFLKKEGRKEFVVLPYEEFVALQELQQLQYNTREAYNSDCDGIPFSVAILGYNWAS